MSLDRWPDGLELQPRKSAYSVVVPQPPVQSQEEDLPSDVRRVRVPTEDLQAPIDGDNYETVESKLLALLDRLKKKNNIYAPQQISALSTAIYALISSFSFERIDYDYKLFGKSILKRTSNCPDRDDNFKIRMLVQIYETINDPCGKLESFSNYIARQEKLYPKNSASMKRKAKLQMIVSVVAMAASSVLSLLTLGWSLLGLTVALPAFIEGHFKYVEAKIAEEMDKLHDLKQVFDTFGPDRDEYDKIKRIVLKKINVIAYSESQDSEVKVDNSIPQQFKDMVLKLIRRLDQTDLSSKEKTTILAEVNRVITSPVENTDSFAEFVNQTKIKHPSDSLKTCLFKQYLGMVGAFIIAGVSLGLSAFYGISLLGLTFSYACGKYASAQQKKISLAQAKETLTDISNLANTIEWRGTQKEDDLPRKEECPPAGALFMRPCR